MRSAAAAGLVAALILALAPAASAGEQVRRRSSQRQLDALITADGGPPGAIVTLRRGSKTTVLSAGVAEVGTRRRPRSRDHMRIASVAKAFSGAVVFRLVARGKLKLSDTVASGPSLPPAWSAVTVAQLLNHTSGLPDYTTSDGFRQQLENDPGGYVSPSKIISWVENDGLEFTPGSRYEYSNTDNIVLGLLAEKATGKSYARLLREIVFRPLRLRRTSLPITPALPRPFIHGYLVGATGPPEDVSTLLNLFGAWSFWGINFLMPRNPGHLHRGHPRRTALPGLGSSGSGGVLLRRG